MRVSEIESTRNRDGTGVMVALVHAVWTTMVWLGVGQGYLDWIFTLHSLDNPFIVLQFDLVRS